MKPNQTETLRRGEKIRYTALGLLLAFVLMALITPALAEIVYQDIRVMYSDISIYVDGQRTIPLDANGKVVDPFVSEGTTYLPVRAISQALGRTVEWDGEANAIYIGGRPSGVTADATRKTIYVIVQVLGNPYWSILEAGAKKAGEDLGCHVVVIGTTAAHQIDQQILLLQDAATKADAIVVAPLDRRALAIPISEQFQSGIPVVLIHAVVDTEDYSAAYLTDQYAAGKLAAETLFKKLQEAGTPKDREGVIALTIGSTSSQEIVDRLDGFRDWWDANAPQAWKVLWDEIKVNEGDIGKARAFGIDFIESYASELIGLYAPNNGSTVGFAMALEQSGRTDIALVGFDFSAEMEALIRSPGNRAATILPRQYYMGYDGVARALQLAVGDKVEGKVVDTGAMVVDNATIDWPEAKILTGR